MKLKEVLLLGMLIVGLIKCTRPSFKYTDPGIGCEIELAIKNHGDMTERDFIAISQQLYAGIMQKNPELFDSILSSPGTPVSLPKDYLAKFSKGIFGLLAMTTGNPEFKEMTISEASFTCPPEVVDRLSQDVLIGRLKSSDDPQVRLEIITKLGEMRAKAEYAIPDLSTRAMDDPDPMVREAAERAIEKIKGE